MDLEESKQFATQFKDDIYQAVLQKKSRLAVAMQFGITTYWVECALLSSGHPELCTSSFLRKRKLDSKNAALKIASDTILETFSMPVETRDFRLSEAFITICNEVIKLRQENHELKSVASRVSILEDQLKKLREENLRLGAKEVMVVYGD